MANLFLDEIDERLSKEGHKYIRYADNYLLMGKNPEETKEVLELSIEMLDRLDLDLEVETVSSFDKGFTYLGVFFLNSVIMKPFDVAVREKTEPIFPKPFHIDVWLKRNGG